MENKNTTVLYALVCLIVGVLLGWLIWRSSPATSNLSASSDMHDTMGQMMTGLSGKAGDAFHAAFIDEMIVHHEGAVAMAQAALTNARHQEIKDMAQAIISAQTKEIVQMKEWRAQWYKN